MGARRSARAAAAGAWLTAPARPGAVSTAAAGAASQRTHTALAAGRPKPSRRRTRRPERLICQRPNPLRGFYFPSTGAFAGSAAEADEAKARGNPLEQTRRRTRRPERRVAPSSQARLVSLCGGGSKRAPAAAAFACRGRPALLRERAAALGRVAPRAPAPGLWAAGLPSCLRQRKLSR